MSDPLHCYRHTTEEVYLRCGKCERPICAKCTKHGPAGARCPECSSISASPLFQVSGGQLAQGVAVGITVSFIMGYLIALGSGLGFFLLWGGLLAGGAVGEAILRITQRKRGLKMEVLTGVCALAGAIFSFLLWYSRIGPTIPGGTLETFIQMNPFYFGALGVMVFSAVSRVRFF